jgi:hypothetical protein
MIGDILCTRPDGTRFYVTGVRYVLKASTEGHVRVNEDAERYARIYADQGRLTFRGFYGEEPLELP